MSAPDDRKVIEHLVWFFQVTKPSCVVFSSCDLLHFGAGSWLRIIVICFKAVSRVARFTEPPFMILQAKANSRVLYSKAVLLHLMCILCDTSVFFFSSKELAA